FFESSSVLSKEVAQILFLFREAADCESVHGDVTVLATCVLFESLVNQLFEQLKLDKAAMAQRFSIRQKCQAVVKHFGLQWEGDMEAVFLTWRAARNPLVHGE